MKRAHWLLALAAAWGSSNALVPNAWAAEGVMLPAAALGNTKVRFDGVPNEWPGRWNDLGTTLRGKPPKGRPSPQGALAYDDKFLYVALRAQDSKLVRTRAAGQKEDHATLILAFPSAKGRYATHRVDLFPGKPGKLAGVVKQGGHVVSGAKLVEAPDGPGFTFEAKIPWSVFPEARRVRVGLRASLRYTDASAPGKISSEVATSPGSKAKALPPMLTDPEYAMYEGLVLRHNLDVEPSREVYGNIAGDGTWERVALYGRYLALVGSRFRKGEQYVVTDLEVQNPRQVTRLELDDFDGDGRKEIVVVLRIGATDRYREVIEVLRLQPDESTKMVFVHEIGIKSAAGELHNEVTIESKHGERVLEIVPGSCEGFDADSYAEPTPADMDGALLPWGAVASRTFSWQSGQLRKSDETAQKPSESAGKAASHRSESASASGSVAVAPPPPRAPTPEEMLDEVYALYRKDRHVRAGKPRFDFVTDVAADATPERVLVHGQDIVCFGSRFRDGASYVYTKVGVSNPDDIIDVTARDLTGDGKANILVRAVTHVTTSEALGKKSVDRLVFLVYQIRQEGIHRIFAAETGRRFEGHLLLGGLRFLPEDRGVTIKVVPGSAHGFTRQSYPFPEDTTASGGFEPLLLPWGKVPERTYSFNGDQFVQR